MMVFAPSHLFAEMRTSNIWGLPDCVTDQGKDIDRLFIVITDLTVLVFIAVMVAMFTFLIKYRARRGIKAIYSHGNNKLEIWWTTIPALIFIAIVVYSNGMWGRIFDPALIPKDALNVEIVAEQFGFNIRYPGSDNVLGKSDDSLFSINNKFGLVMEDPANKQGFTTYNDLEIPVGRAIHLYLRSKDVIHAFFVPEFRLGQDMVPGRTISYMWFRTTRTGNFNICCNQLCGAGHYNMQSKLKVLSKEDFEKWYQSKLPATAQNNSSKNPIVLTSSAAAVPAKMAVAPN